jgi:trans-aconitate methyltransferase
MTPEPIRPALDRSRVVEHFDKLAEGYGTGEYYTIRRDAVVAALRSIVAGANRILDLGCGNGHYLRAFREINSNATIVGTDLAPEMLVESRRKAPSVALVRADVTALPYRDRAFDLIFASHVLQFITDTETTVAHIAERLADRGVFAATVGGGGIGRAMRSFEAGDQWIALRRSIFGGEGNERRFLDETVYRESFARAGLEVETRTLEFEIAFEGIAEWVEIRWGPVATAEQNQQVARILDDLKARFAGQRFTVDEKLLLGRAA